MVGRQTGICLQLVLVSCLMYVLFPPGSPTFCPLCKKDKCDFFTAALTRAPSAIVTTLASLMGSLPEPMWQQSAPYTTGALFVVIQFPWAFCDNCRGLWCWPISTGVEFFIYECIVLLKPAGNAVSTRFEHTCFVCAFSVTCINPWAGISVLELRCSAWSGLKMVLELRELLAANLVLLRHLHTERWAACACIAACFHVTTHTWARVEMRPRVCLTLWAHRTREILLEPAVLAVGLTYCTLKRRQSEKE